MRLSLGECLRFLGSTPLSWNMVEGKSVFDANHIILYGITSSAGNYKKEIFALCLQSSALSAQPHEIKIMIADVDDKLVVDTAFCSCKGGAHGKCKHVSAFLWICMAKDIENFSQITCTDMACYWKYKQNEKVQKYKLNKAKDLCGVSTSEEMELMDMATCITEAARGISTSSFARESTFRDLYADDESSSNLEDSPAIEQNIDEVLSLIKISMEKGEATSLTEIQGQLGCCKDTYNKLFMDEDSFLLPKFTLGYGTDWKRCRRFKITGSRCYSAYTYTKNPNPDWCLRANKYFLPKSFTNKYVQHGLVHEDAALKSYEQTTNCRTIKVGLISPHNIKWMGFSPDALVIENGHIKTLVEVKCPYQGKLESVETFFDSLPYISNGELNKKHQYYGQVQWGMGILGINVCDFVLFSSIDHKIKIIKVTKDDVFVKKLFITLQKVYFDKLLHIICENKEWFEDV